MIQIQRELTERCLELLNLPDGSPSLILDVGFVEFPNSSYIIHQTTSCHNETLLQCVLYLFLSFWSSCGSGLSGEAISNKGHFWIGFDISHDMLGMSL